MRTLLRNKITGTFFQSADKWIDSAADAFDFKMTERAIQFLRDAPLNISELELILAFDDARFNITLPVYEKFGMLVAEQPAHESRVFG